MLSLETLRTFFSNKSINHPFKSFLLTGAMHGSELENSTELCDRTGMDLMNSEGKVFENRMVVERFYSTQISHNKQNVGQKHTKKINP